MNKLLIPTSPNWYETDIMACGSDNTLIYGSRQDIVVIKPTPETEPDDVQVISKAHSMRIKSVNINRNWGQPHKYAVTVADDSVVKVWDIETLKKVSSHNKHGSLSDKSKLVGASFAGDDRVVSVSENGTIVIWNITLNQSTVLSMLFDSKVTVTCLSVCPHATWLAGFGLKSGLIIVADLRRSGRILHHLRGHNKAVVSLSWCPAPVNIFPVKPNNKVVEKCLEVSEENKTDNQKRTEGTESSEKTTETENKTDTLKSSETAEEDVIEDRRKQKNPKKLPNPWAGLVHADDEPPEVPKIQESQNDFLKECLNLRTQILHRSSPKVESKSNEGSPTQDTSQTCPRVILKARSRNQKCNLSELLLKKQQTLQTSTEKTQNSEEILSPSSVTEVQTVETPTDLREISMEISKSVEKKLEPKLTDLNEKSMELTDCGRGGSVTNTETSFSDCSDCSKPNTTSSSEDKIKFSSASSCDNDLNCSKRCKDILEVDDVNSSGVESGDVFIDAQNVDEKAGESVENWRTEEPTVVEEQPRKEYLLASSAKDPNIYIWRGIDGRMQTFMTLPIVKTKRGPARSDKIWVTICWVAPNILLSSSRYAELLQWTLPKPMVQSKCVRQVHKDHWSALFSIKAPIVYLNEYNFLQKRDINAWTTGMDRLILSTDIKTMKNLACYPALGGSVNCVSGSPVDPNRLAFGTGEGIVNVWDLSREHKKRIVFSTFYQKILSSVTALAWHPLNESSLAWGTLEGRVGILETASKSKVQKILPQYFKSQIFKLEWGPLNGDVQNLALYVVSESKVAVFNPKSQDKAAHILEMPDNTLVYTMSWKPDYSALLVASKTGSLITYTPDLKISNISYVRLKLQSIVWNPNAASTDASQKYCNTFVSIVKSYEFVVYDLGLESDNNDDKIIAHFENRKVLINSIEWNPHCASQLVFIDIEGVAQVYDIETKTVLSTYVSPYLDSLSAVYWSPVDQDYIITGTAYHKMIVWKVSENKPLTEQEINSRRNKFVKAQQKEVGDQLPKEKVEVPTAEIPETTKKTTVKSQYLPVFYILREKSQASDIKKLLQSKLGDKSVEANSGDNRQIDVLDVFDDQSKMDKVLDFNITTFLQQGKYHNANLLSLFKGDLDGAIKSAIDEKRVNPWIISMCPMVSPKLWQTACETYANQLLEEPEADPMEIVTYLLACHKVEEAVDTLCEREMFREALVLAKARFGVDNTVVTDVLDKWAKKMVYQGNFEFAAQCYITLGRFEDAAMVLFRRSSIELLELAVELAKLSGNEDMQKAIVSRFNAIKNESESPKGANKSDEENGKDTSEAIAKDVSVDGHVIITDICEISKIDTDQNDSNTKNINDICAISKVDKDHSGNDTKVNETYIVSKDDKDQKDSNAIISDTCVVSKKGKDQKDSNTKISDVCEVPKEADKNQNKNVECTDNSIIDEQISVKPEGDNSSKSVGSVGENENKDCDSNRQTCSEAFQECKSVSVNSREAFLKDLLGDNKELKLDEEIDKLEHGQSQNVVGMPRHVQESRREGQEESERASLRKDEE